MFDKKTLTDKDLELLKEKYPTDFLWQIEKVNNGYPVQYLIGNVDFLNTNILVNEHVLIPRFETEYLVEKVLEKAKAYKNEPLKCLDICTGSGCIAIAIAKNTNFKVKGLDISRNALQVAKENTKRNNVPVEFVELDILNENITETYDIIIANPPYIDKEEIVDESIKYEPQIALFAEHSGLIFYEEVLKKIKNKPKLIAFEIGELQGERVINLAKKHFPDAKITLEKDLCGKDRYIFIE